MIITDEMLNAYLDGELATEQMDEIDSILASDETLRVRLEAFAEADRVYKSELAAVDAHPLPSGMAELLATPTAVSRANIVDFPFKARLERARPFLLPTAIAASIAAIVGFGTGFAIGPAGLANDPFSTLSRGSNTVIAVLDERESGQSVDIGNGMTAQVRLTFPAEDGRLCRELNIQSSRAAAAGVACRSGDKWDVRLASRQPAPVEGTGYITAASADDPVFGRAVDAMMTGDPLDKEAEAAAIKNGWSKKMIPDQE